MEKLNNTKSELKKGLLIKKACILGYSWECDRLLLRICRNDFWFLWDTYWQIGLLNLLDSLVECCWSFVWFLQKLQWFNKNTQFSNYSIWNIYSTSKTLPIQKKMKSQWREVLRVYYLNNISCRAKLEELQKFIPYYSEKCKQIISNASSPFKSIATHDLSFPTWFIVAALFLMVKASSHTTYHYLTLQMVESIG